LFYLKEREKKAREEYDGKATIGKEKKETIAQHGMTDHHQPSGTLKRGAEEGPNNVSGER